MNVEQPLWVATELQLHPYVGIDDVPLAGATEVMQGGLAPF